MESNQNTQPNRRNDRGLHRRTWREHVVVLLTVAWAVGVGTGMYQLWCYGQKPGARDTSPIRWPEASRIPRPADKPALILFAHPRCPCTRASLRELEQLATRIEGRAEMHVVFMDSSMMGEARAGTDIQSGAAMIRGARIFCDTGGSEEKLFGARTSGLVLLYSHTGELLFQGGITPSRGHEGDNAGIAALEDLVENHHSHVPRTPVFGCPLQEPDLLATQDLSL